MEQPISSESVQSQAVLILGSPPFKRAPRRARLLTYLLQEQLAGRGDSIKQSTIALELEWPESEVRKVAGQVREALTAYYGTVGSQDLVLIDIPRGGFVPSYSVRPQPAASHSGSAVPGNQPTRRIWLLGVVALAAAALVLLFAGPPTTRTMELEGLPFRVTPKPGSQIEPRISPNGKTVAFAMRGEGRPDFDISVYDIETRTFTQVTSDPLDEVAPDWSGDGRQLAYIRNPGPLGEVFIVALESGKRQRVGTATGDRLAWMPRPGPPRYLAVVDRLPDSPSFELRLIDLDKGISAPMGISWRDEGSCPGGLAFAPDGASLVVAFSCDLWLYRLDGGSPPKPRLGPIRLTPGGTRFQAGFAWIDNESVVYSADQGTGPALWQVQTSRPRSLQKLSSSPADGMSELSVSRVNESSLRRMSYLTGEDAVNIWKATRQKDGTWDKQQILPSEARDLAPQISQDGGIIALASDRYTDGRSFEILLCSPAGVSAPDFLRVADTRGSPRWSPDGARLAFDVLWFKDRKRRRIYVTDLRERKTWPASPEDEDAVRPSWSGDGEWIYYGARLPSGGWQVKRVSPDGKRRQVISASGGFEAFEAPDGRSVYYVDSPDVAGLWQATIGEGGTAKRLEAGKDVIAGHWTVSDRGIYYIDAANLKQPQEVKLLKLPAGRIERTNLEVSGANKWYPGLSSSKDGTVLVGAGIVKDALRVLVQNLK